MIQPAQVQPAHCRDIAVDRGWHGDRRLRLASVFRALCPGIGTVMTPEQFPDAVPDADAAEQSRNVHEQALDDEAAVSGPAGPPMDATAHDWQEQTEVVDIDPDEDDLGRDA